MIRIKICGLTRLTDALAAVEAGADALGFVFWAKSPRAISPAVAREIVREVAGRAETVGVFVDEEPWRLEGIVREVGIDVAQLHGREDAAYVRRLSVRCYPAFRIRGREDEAAIRARAPARFLLDAYRPGVPGGTGESFDWEVARRLRDVGELWLAGGLSPANVARALDASGPAGVDVSSSLEARPGEKDPDRIRSFIQEVRRWEIRRVEAGSADGSAGSSSPRP